MAGAFAGKGGDRLTITEANAVNRIVDYLIGEKRGLDPEDVCALLKPAYKALMAGWTPEDFRKRVLASGPRPRPRGVGKAAKA